MAKQSEDVKDSMIKALQERVRELEFVLGERGHREYKSRLFAFIFGREENKAWTLELYNAVHGTDYTDVSLIEINTMEDVVYMGMKNDLSFIISEAVDLYRFMDLHEQQSTYNPNSPVREFMYLGKLYDKFLYVNKLNRYGSKLIPLPIPKLVVLYNGKDRKGMESADEVELSLSDAFKAEIRRGLAIARKTSESKVPDADVDERLRLADPDVSVKVRMININSGHSEDIMNHCKPLKEYARFVERVRQNIIGEEETGMGLEMAIDKAIDEMPRSFVISKFILDNRAAVKDMCLTEYNEVEAMELFRLEGHEEGRKVGREEGRKVGREEGKNLRDREKVKELLDRGRSPKEIVDFCGYPMELVMSVQRESTGVSI